MPLLALVCAFLLFCPATPGQAAEPLEQAVFAALNRARSEPQGLLPQLQSFRSLFEGEFWRAPGSPVRVRTREGVAAVDEAIAFVSRQPPLKPLQWSPGLAAAAAELADAQQRSGATGHGERQLELETRLGRHGRWTDAMGENVGYGDYRPEEAEAVIRQAIIDDGVRGRGHRANLFSGDYQLVGIACAPHPKYGSVCVFDFAGGRGD